MIARWLTQTLERSIAHVPAVALLGARQVGKTTLARKVARNQPAIYLDLESPDDLLKLSDPVSFLSMHSDKLIILDEIQRAPDLFKTLRGIIDNNRAAGKQAAQFLLLGSASMDLLRQSSESLAGRISYLALNGLNVLEIGDNPQQALWLRGGFPNSYLALEDTLSMDWLEDLIRTYLERDIPQMGFHIPANRLRRLWTMLAHLQGEPVNYSKLGNNLEIDGKLVSYYIAILIDLQLIRRLEPWNANVKKRLVKSPRFYIRDTGLLHRLLGISDHGALLSHPVLGKSWEGFVIENLHTVLPRRTQTYFYRTAAGAEIDLIITLSCSERWAIEIKQGTSPKCSKYFHQICDDVGVTHKYIVYGGEDEFPVGHAVTVISLKRLMNRLASHA